MDIRCTQYSIVQRRFLPLFRMELRQKGRGEAEGRVGIQIGSLPRWLRRCFDRLKESQRWGKEYVCHITVKYNSCLVQNDPCDSTAGRCQWNNFATFAPPAATAPWGWGKEGNNAKQGVEVSWCTSLSWGLLEVLFISECSHHKIEVAWG